MPGGKQGFGLPEGDLARYFFWKAHGNVCGTGWERRQSYFQGTVQCSNARGIICCVHFLICVRSHGENVLRVHPLSPHREELMESRKEFTLPSCSTPLFWGETLLMRRAYNFFIATPRWSSSSLRGEMASLPLPHGPTLLGWDHKCLNQGPETSVVQA